MQLCDTKRALDDVDASVLVISFEDPASVRKFGPFRALPFTVLSDPSRQLYEAFGLRSRPLRYLFDRTTMVSYLRGLVHRRVPRLRDADFHQLGGDVVLNGAGDVVFVHRSSTPADRPPVELLLRMLREAGG